MVGTVAGAEALQIYTKSRELRRSAAKSADPSVRLKK
jgi:hypothetical protein